MTTILCCIAIAILFGGMFIAASLEKRDYNNGICPKCGHPLRHFDDCFCGDNLWTCDNCDYFTSVSYKRFVYGKKGGEQ